MPERECLPSIGQAFQPPKFLQACMHTSAQRYCMHAAQRPYCTGTGLHKSSALEHIMICPVAAVVLLEFHAMRILYAIATTVLIRQFQLAST